MDEKHYKEKYKIVGEFSFKENKYILYRLNDANTEIFITGDRYEWEFALRWDKTIEHIVKDYFVEEELKTTITRLLA